MVEGDPPAEGRDPSEFGDERPSPTASLRCCYALLNEWGLSAHAPFPSPEEKVYKQEPLPGIGHVTGKKEAGGRARAAVTAPALDSSPSAQKGTNQRREAPPARGA